MADPELAVLASDIRALSVLLSVADYYWWPSAPRSRTESADSKSFSHISTLVGLSSSIPVAVTGMIAAGEATVTIVCPRTRRLKAQQLPDQDLVESHSIQRNTRTLKEILQGASTPQSLGGYVSDLVALFGMVHSRNISSVTIIRWIIRRSWSILDARMKRSQTDFMGDLFVLMASWSPDDNDRIPEEVINMPITSSDVYKTCGLTVDHVSSIASGFPLNKTSASILVKTIAQIFIHIRTTMADCNVDRSDAARSLVNPFIWLHGVLTNRHVETLMTGTSLRAQLIPNQLDRDGDEHRDGWEPRPGPSCMREIHYGLRYLRMLVACVTSVLRLDDPKILPFLAATNVTIASIASPRARYDTTNECRTVVQAIVDEIKQCAPAGALWPDAAFEWMWKCADAAAPGEQEACNVHAEAGLMALACEAKVSHDGAGGEHHIHGHAFSTIMQTPIGISVTSGKCCPLCLRLKQLLNAHFALLGDPEALVLSHPETHGKVLPWGPPQFGIPKSVLKQLRDELWERFVGKAISVGRLRVCEADQPGSDGYTYDEDILAIYGEEVRAPDGLGW